VAPSLPAYIHARPESIDLKAFDRYACACRCACACAQCRSCTRRAKGSKTVRIPACVTSEQESGAGDRGPQSAVYCVCKCEPLRTATER